MNILWIYEIYYAFHEQVYIIQAISFSKLINIRELIFNIKVLVYKNITFHFCPVTYHFK